MLLIKSIGTKNNGESYKLNIKDIEHAHRTDYKPKVQLLQTKDDDKDGEMVTFKQVRYTVKKLIL